MNMCLHLFTHIERQHHKDPIYVDGYWSIYTEKKVCNKCGKVMEVR